MNQHNNLDGRGICIFDSGLITIGYFDNCYDAPGNYIFIYSDGRFDVGEMCLKDGQMRNRGTRYKKNGTALEFGY